MCESRASLEAALSRLVADLDPSLLHGNDAKILVGFFSRLERLACAGKALCALRVASTGAFEADGHRDAGAWLAGETRDSLGNALSLLEAAEAVAKLPELEQAVRSGELSAAQVKEVASAATVDPGATTGLLGAARTEDFSELRRRCGEVKAARASAEDEAARARRLHRARRLRTWTEGDGTFRLDARLAPAAGARLLAAVRDEADRVFRSSRHEGVREPKEAYLADALVNLVTRETLEAPARPKALVHLRVDLTALKRGSTGPGEMCEIAGVGPVSVATARELLGESIAKILVTSATDVHAICNLGRAVPARLQSALLERDRCCVVPGCAITRNLEIDHRVVPFADGGPTELANLARICHHHHFLKTHEGYALEGEPGAWVWVHPDGTRHGPGLKAPPGTEPGAGDPATTPGLETTAAPRPEPPKHGPTTAGGGKDRGHGSPPAPEQAGLFAVAGHGAGGGHVHAT